MIKLQVVVSVLRLIFRLFHKLFKRRQGSGKLLVIQPYPGIGDVIWFLPHMHALADAKGPVTLLTKPRSMAEKLLDADPKVEKVIWVERNPGRHSGITGLFRLVADLRKHNFSEAWIFHGSSRYAWAVYFAGIPVTWSFGKKLQKLLVTQNCFLSAKEQKLHAINKSNTLLDRAGVSFTEREPDFFIAEKTKAIVRKEYGLPADKTALASFALGSSAAYKQWGQDNFLELGCRLAEKGIVKIFLIGGPAEQAMVDEMLGRWKNTDCELVGIVGLPLEKVAALISCTGLCVGNDTGILNLSAAVKTISFGLFAATPALTNSSCMVPLKVDRAPGQPPATMQDLTVDQVFKAIDEKPAINLPSG